MKKLIISLIVCCQTLYATAQMRQRVQTNIPQNASYQRVPTATEQRNAMRDKSSMQIQPWQSGTYKNAVSLGNGNAITQTYVVNQKLEKVSLHTPTENNIKRSERNQRQTEPSKTAGGWEHCETKEVRVTASNIGELQIDNSAQIANIVPGYLYTFRDYIKGNWKPIDANRKPVNLITSVNNTNGAPSVLVNNPDRSNLNNAKNTLFARSTSELSKTAQESFQYKCYEVESVSDLAIKMGVSGYGWGASVSSLMSSTKNAKSRYLLIDFTKSMFSISCAPTQAGIIDAAFAEEDMMYVSNVSYGVRVIAVAELEAYDSDVSANISAKVNYGVAGGQADFNYFSNQSGFKSTIRFYVVGGQSNQVETVYSFNELKSVCNNISKTANYQNVVPIKYQMRNLNNDLVIANSATDYFKTQNCIFEKAGEAPKSKTLTLSLESITKADPAETDIEIYGQIWAQVFDKNGKEILPIGNRDRLFALDQHQHLTNATFRNLNYSPNISSSFFIPAEKADRVRVVVYYWLMEYDSGSGDDFLSMQHGSKGRYNRNNIEYYIQEFTMNNTTDNLQKQARFVDQDGESAVDISLMANAKFN